MKAKSKARKPSSRKTHKAGPSARKAAPRRSFKTEAEPVEQDEIN